VVMHVCADAGVCVLVRYWPLKFEQTRTSEHGLDVS